MLFQTLTYKKLTQVEKIQAPEKVALNLTKFIVETFRIQVVNKFLILMYC